MLRSYLERSGLPIVTDDNNMLGGAGGNYGGGGGGGESGAGAGKAGQIIITYFPSSGATHLLSQL